MLSALLYRLQERYYDWRWGVRTYSYVSKADLGYGDESLEYAPVPYMVLFKLYEALPGNVRGGRVIDFGCGLGRVLIAAHRLGFAPITGVELSAALCEKATPNIAGLPIEIVNQDATTYEMPPRLDRVLLLQPVLRRAVAPGARQH